MPRFILKASPTEDLYVEWSTVVDNLISVGTRQEFQNRFELEMERGLNSEYALPRFDRADEMGTSALDGDYGWDQDGFIVHNLTGETGLHAGWLPRSKLYMYAMNYYRNEVLKAEMLVEPFEDGYGRISDD